jgi:cytoskeletal protein RodZ
MGISFMQNKLGDRRKPRLGVRWEKAETALSGSSQKAFRAHSGGASILPAMTPAERARQHANRKRARIHRIRVRVATLTVTIFIAVFAVIYVQMVQGRDPALSNNAAVTTTTTTTSSASTTSTDSTTSSDSSTTDDSSTSSDNSSSDQSSSNSSPAPVQTSQS